MTRPEEQILAIKEELEQVRSHVSKLEHDNTDLRKVVAMLAPLAPLVRVSPELSIIEQVTNLAILKKPVIFSITAYNTSGDPVPVYAELQKNQFRAKVEHVILNDQGQRVGNIKTIPFTCYNRQQAKENGIDLTLEKTKKAHFFLLFTLNVPGTYKLSVLKPKVNVVLAGMFNFSPIQQSMGFDSTTPTPPMPIASPQLGVSDASAQSILANIVPETRSPFMSSISGQTNQLHILNSPIYVRNMFTFDRKKTHTDLALEEEGLIARVVKPGIKQRFALCTQLMDVGGNEGSGQFSWRIRIINLRPQTPLFLGVVQPEKFIVGQRANQQEDAFVIDASNLTIYKQGVQTKLFPRTDAGREKVNETVDFLLDAVQGNLRVIIDGKVGRTISDWELFRGSKPYVELLSEGDAVKLEFPQPYSHADWEDITDEEGTRNLSDGDIQDEQSF
ncbi:MAG: hypothetical protein EZS28_024975 [Streblomastix strix]|uniref:B30.2/SPRY domain-containing protein n=1 Tax=Streblomastix strix TaxID=222440 RepID=A0A5J4VA78_9EUKA|nr:MAG: hypothetical protein EZS28_024975 [Streblomastix strix]